MLSRFLARDCLRIESMVILIPSSKAILSFGYNASFVELVKGIGSFRFDSITKNWWKIYKSKEEANKELSQLPPGIDVNLNKITSFHKFK